MPGGGTRIAVRDSQHPGGASLVFAAPEWHAFVASAKNGEFG
jgi:hypothetical protein